MGTIVFGPGGEWVTPRVLQVQFQGITDHAVSQFEDGSRQVVDSPPEFRSGALRSLCAEALT